MAVVFIVALWVASTMTAEADVEVTPWGDFYESYGDVYFQATQSFNYRDNTASSIYVERTKLEVSVTGGTNPLQCTYRRLESEADGQIAQGTDWFDPMVYPGQYAYKEYWWNSTRAKAPNQPLTSVYGAGASVCGLVWPTAGWDIYSFADTSFLHQQYN